MRQYVIMAAKLLLGAALGIGGAFMMLGAREAMGDSGWHLFVPGLLCGLACVAIWVHVFSSLSGGR